MQKKMSINVLNLSIFEMLAPKLFLAVGFVLVVILSFATCSKHGLTKLSTLMFMIVGYASGIYCAGLMGALYTAVSKMYGGGTSNLAIFGVVVSLPFILIAAALLSGKPWRGVTDLFAPGAILGLAFSKFGCFFYGCCPGIECDFGLYNKLYERVMFPSQLCESITMVFVVAFGFWYTNKKKNRTPGSAYPVTAMVYVTTRFLWEFLRYYDIDKMKHLLFGLSFWQLWCIVVFVISAIWLLILKNPKLPEYEKRYYAKHAEVVEKLKSKLTAKKEASAE